MLEKEEIFSKVLRAGRRTYFFDVRATKQMIILRLHSFLVSKIYLYKEDFSAFAEIGDMTLCFKPQRRRSNFRKTSKRFQKRICY
jgi:hypothetical protein